MVISIAASTGYTSQMSQFFYDRKSSNAAMSTDSSRSAIREPYSSLNHGPSTIVFWGGLFVAYGQFCVTSRFYTSMVTFGQSQHTSAGLQ